MRIREASVDIKAEGRRRTANVLVNPHIDEVLISDYLAGELGIVILDPRRGLWKFADEDLARESVEPQRWR
ncbi:hypothetical protein [Thermoproteus uzoniensis]|uniref:hypothetical protein n=1 Tax=Thermoproteus uzoniensis TaxID=184117 RepID=UPI001F19BE0C|nr:hypothetical protein [Thermoproteus uzoniensis]